MARSSTGFSGGIMVPVQPGQDGGFRLVDGDEYVSQLIRGLVADCDCENPFLRIGMGLEAIFANVSDGGWRAQQQKKIVDVFRRLQRAQIAKLVNTEWSAGALAGEFNVTIRYLSIESSTEQDVAVRLGRR